MWTRRAFLHRSTAVGMWLPIGAAVRAEAVARRPQQSAEEVAVIEPYWREVRQQFALDPALMNLDNAAGSPMPSTVQSALKRHLDDVNRLPAEAIRGFEDRLTQVRRELAQDLGCDHERLTLTSGGAEALQIAQAGIELKEGDEILITDAESAGAVRRWEQRARREGIVLKTIPIPQPATAAAILAACQSAMTARTRVLQFPHVANRTGQLFPARELSSVARARGVVTLVDGSQAVGHFPFQLRELECDVYAAGLDTWLLAPPGTGILYARQGSEVAPAEATSASVAAQASIGEAITFHRAVGTERKVARLRYLTMRWINGVRSRPQVQIVSSVEANQPVGLAACSIRGIPAEKAAATLREKDGIVVGAHGVLRVSPQVYTSVEEIDRFVSAVRALL